jgi:hypothetical protein
VQISTVKKALGRVELMRSGYCVQVYPRYRMHSRLVQTTVAGCVNPFAGGANQALVRINQTTRIGIPSECASDGLGAVSRRPDAERGCTGPASLQRLARSGIPCGCSISAS